MTEKLSKAAVIKQARAEVAEEHASKYKKEYKAKLRERIQAERVLSNIDREIAELELKMNDEL
jgi:hypothetical protein